MRLTIATPPQADQTNLVAVVGMKGTEALAAMGLQALPVEP